MSEVSPLSGPPPRRYALALPAVLLLAACVERTLPAASPAPPAPADAGSRRDAGRPPLVLASLPADGARDVPPSLATVAVLLAPGATDLTAYVRTAAGRSRARLVQSRCELHGFPVGASCAEIPLPGPLDRDADLAVEVEAGQQGVGARVGLHTAAEDDRRPPVLAAPFPCAADELALVRACVRVEDFAIVVRLTVDEPARCGASGLDVPEVDAWYAGGVASLRLGGLVPEREQRLWWWATDLAGNRTDDGPLVVRTAPGRAPVAIVEVSPNPRGPEPAQEWIEVLSWGASEIDVEGFVVQDDSDTGIVLPAGPPLGPGERALVVSSSYDAADPRDPPPAPGTRLLRVAEAGVGHGGLRNSGERLVLRDREGRVVSRAPALDVPAGSCAVRTGGPAVDDASAWVRGPCTPGAPP